jgi:hypothetical protein
MNSFNRTDHMRTSWIAFGAFIVIVLALVTWKTFGVEPRASSQEVARVKPSSETRHVESPRPDTSPSVVNASLERDAGVDDAPTRMASLTPIPPIGTRGKSKVWLRTEYGKGEDQLGFSPIPRGGAGEARVPQGFVITPDGELLVLDSEKMRLVWFGPDARIRRKSPLEGLLMPADVAVAADGTIVVMDHEGLHTKGTLLLDPEGKPKGMLPKSGGGMIRELYVVGNDIFGDVGGTLKLGETSGVPSHETPALYDQDGRIPGGVAPDGRTVFDASIHDREGGSFLLTVLRDDPPKHLYTRQYTIPVKQALSGIVYLQSDAAGTLYLVLYYDRDQTMLVCFDGETGDPLGSVAMPMDDTMTGAAFKQFAVNREQGGLVYHHLLEGVSSFEIYDCR